MRFDTNSVVGEALQLLESSDGSFLREIRLTVDRAVPGGFARSLWSGVERLHFELAKKVKMLQVVPAAHRHSWKLVLEGPSGESVSVLALASVRPMYHGTLTVGLIRPWEEETAYRRIGSPDHWARVHVWTRAVARILGAQEIVDERNEWLRAAVRLREMVAELVPRVEAAHQRLFPGEEVCLGVRSVGVTSAMLRPDTVGVSKPPARGMPYTVLGVHPKLLGDWDFIEVVLTHELIHEALGDHRDNSTHGKRFRKLASALGVPERYQD